jgi:hypothetical protein
MDDLKTRVFWSQIQIHPLAHYTSMVKSLNPAAFVRWGDGELYAIVDQTKGRNIDDFYRVPYYPDMTSVLRGILLRKPNYLMGIAPQVHDSFNLDIARWFSEHGLLDLSWTNVHTLPIASRFGELKPFLDAIKDSPKPLIVGPKHLSFFVAKLKNAEHIVIDDKRAWLEREETYNRLRVLLASGKPRVVTFSAGATSNYLIDSLWRELPRHVYIDVGSLWDPFAGIRSRDYMMDETRKFEV